MVIELKNVVKTFSGTTTVHALRGVDLWIPAGQIFGIIGQSGAGKSTLVRCINMLERPDQGEVWVNGILLNDLHPRKLREQRKNIGMIFQHFNLLNSRTVFNNIAFPLEIAGLSKGEIRTKIHSLADLVGLDDKLQSYPGQLSGGQKQRVGIARALATEPSLLLCDEATSALDPETTKSVLQLLQRINATLGLTIVLITHEMAVIQEICDSVAVLEDGRVQESGPVVNVFTKPQSPATRRMLQGFLTTVPPNDVSAGNGTLLQLTFIDQRAHQPIISRMVRRHEVDVNILFGRIDQMKEIPFGMLMVEICGNATQVEAAIGFLRENQVEVEVLNNCSQMLS